MVIISINGALGFLRSNSIMLHFFAWTLILLFITLFAGSIAAWAMSRSLRKFFKFIFLASVLNYNPDQRWALSGLVDYTQSTMGCCGSKESFLVHSSSDYHGHMACPDVLRKPNKNYTDWGRPGNKWHQIHCGNDTTLEIDTDYADDYEDATGNETGSQIRKRRQMEIDITQPQIIPQPEKPKLTNRKDSTTFHFRIRIILPVIVSHSYDSWTVSHG